MFDFVYRIFFGADQWRKYLAAIAAFVFSELVVVVLFGQRITSAVISFQVLIALAAFCGGSWALMYLPDRAQEHLLSSVETEAALLDYRIAALEVQFRRDLENWLMWPVKDDVLPHRIQHDVDTARSLTVGTVCGLLATAALSGWIFDSQHIRAWYGFGAGILVTQVLFAVLSSLFTDHELPQFAVRALRRLVLVPAVVLLFSAIASVLFIRSSADATSGAVLLPIALWVSMLSLTLLAAALQVNARMLRWSVRFERKWLRLRRLAQRNSHRNLSASEARRKSPSTR